MWRSALDVGSVGRTMGYVVVVVVARCVSLLSLFSLIVLLDTVEVVHAQRLAPVDGAAVDGGGVREAIGGVHGDGGHEPCERRETLGGEDIKDEQDGEEREGHTVGAAHMPRGGRVEGAVRTTSERGK